MSDWIDIGAAEDFVENAPKAIRVGGAAIAVFRLGDELHALRDLCTHGHARLSDGYVENDCVECPLHQGLFDIRTGEARCPPVTEAVRSFPVRVVAGRAEIALSETAVVAESAPQTLVATISSIERPAPDIAVLKLALLDEATLDYRAGQYLTVALADGLQRSYSMATPASGGSLELHIRHLPGGLFTDQVFSRFTVGERLSLAGPSGDFYLREAESEAVLLASGTGFAPIKAIVESAIQSGATRRMVLYWGGRRPSDLYMNRVCERWAKELPWFRYVPVLSEPQESDCWTGRSGLVHQAIMDDLTDLSTRHVYACGAPAMIDAARRDFVEHRGLTPEAFFSDAFTSRADFARSDHDSTPSLR